MKFINFAVVKFSILLALGIITSYFFPVNFPFLVVLPILIGVLAFLFFYYKNRITENLLFAIITYFTFFVIGYANFQNSQPDSIENHFSNFVSSEENQLLQLKIREQLKSDSYNDKYVAEVFQINSNKAKGKILFIIKKDSVYNILKPDELLLITSEVKSINAPLNPHQFDYKKYMSSLSVFGQTTINKDQILIQKMGASSIRGTAQKFRNFLISKLEQSPLNPRERGIIMALILGEKRGIDKQLYNDYAAAGAVHILAVSGLHVGILLVLLTFLSKPLTYLKNGNIIAGCVIVLCLWAFAFITGLSPSVTRAVTMFSFFAFANAAGRPTNGINTLFLSFLVLLVINPLWLFQVGFQLSYAAVLFILWLHPLFTKSIIRSKYWLVRKGTSIITVTLAAQIGVLPLTLYYFHQFPGLFLLTNIVVLPIISLLMYGGILIVFLAAVNGLPEWLAIAYNYCIEQLNNFVHWVAMQEQFLFQDLHFPGPQVMTSYLLLISLLILWKVFDVKRIIAVLAMFTIFISTFVWDKFETSNDELIVFNKTAETVISYKNDSELTVFRNDSIENSSLNTLLRSYSTATNSQITSSNKVPSVLKYDKKSILILDSIGAYPKLEKVDFLVLTQSPKINFERMLDSLKPNFIIADASNYKGYVTMWKETCEYKKVPFHYTAEMGSYVIK